MVDAINNDRVPPAWPRTDADAVKAGHELLAIRDALRGGFKAWVLAACPYSYRSAAEWMRRARDAPIRKAPDPVLPMDFLVPAERDPSAGLTDEDARELLNLAMHGTEGIGVEGSRGFNRSIEVIGYALSMMPSATMRDVREAAHVAAMYARLLADDLECLAAMMRAQPDDGLLASTPIAKQSKPNLHTAQIERSGQNEAEQM